MAKAVSVLKQVKITTPRKHGGLNTCYLDLVQLDNGWYSVRVYKTSKAKTSYSVNYGVVSSHTHAGEHITGWNESTFQALDDASIAFDQKMQDSKVSVVRKLKLFN